MAAILKKIEKLPYLRNRLTDFNKMWQDDASRASAPDRQLKFPEFENSRYQTATILKNRTKNRLIDFNEIWHDEASRTP